MDEIKPTLVDRFVEMAQSRIVLPILFLIQVAETTIIPMPFEAIFIALCLAAPKRILSFLIVTVIGSITAAGIMYGLGSQFAEPVAEAFGLSDQFRNVEAQFAERGGILVFLGGVTPVPSYLVNLAAGASGYPLVPFLTIFGASRFLRFALIAGLFYFFSDEIKALWSRIPKRLRMVATALFILVITIWFTSDLISAPKP